MVFPAVIAVQLLTGLIEHLVVLVNQQVRLVNWVTVVRQVIKQVIVVTAVIQVRCFLPMP